MIVSRIGDKEIITDSPGYKKIDGVLPINEGSGQRYLAEHLLVSQGDSVLDLGTGSGIFAICVADISDKVIATDINPRALKFAKFNAFVNHVSEKIEFREGDLYEPVKREKFDLIVTNPPYVPMPPDLEGVLHSQGGYDGLGSVRRVLGGVNEHLKENGKFQMLCLSLGNDKKPKVRQYLEETFKYRNNEVSLIHLYSPMEIEIFTSIFNGYKGYEGWVNSLKREGMTKLYDMIIETKPSDHFLIIEKDPQFPDKKEFPDERFRRDCEYRFGYLLTNKK